MSRSLGADAGRVGFGTRQKKTPALASPEHFAGLTSPAEHRRPGWIVTCGNVLMKRQSRLEQETTFHTFN